MNAPICFNATSESDTSFGYRNRIHESPCERGLNTTLFIGQEWVFQQDSVPAHKATMTQEWLRRNILAFFSAKNWPSGSPDLNPLDCKLGRFEGRGLPKASRSCVKERSKVALNIFINYNFSKHIHQLIISLLDE